MRKRINKAIIIFILIFGFFAFVFNLSFSQERRPNADIRETVIQLQQLIRQKQAQGADVSGAIELDEQSRQAMRQGRPDECLRLLEEAIALLSGNRNKPQAAGWLMDGQVSAFVMVHFEAGGDSSFYINQEIVRKELSLGPEYISNKSLNYQKALWPTAIRLVNLANSYNFKLTLAFNPQWAEFILKDEEKINIVKEWQRQGHEIAFHHHGINHIDWNGYTNRFDRTSYPDDRKYLDKYDSTDYRGEAGDGFRWIEELNLKINSSNKVITGCVGDTKIDKPDEIRNLTAGSYDLSKDMISKPKRLQTPKGEIIWLRHAQLRSNFNKAGSRIYNEQQNYTKSKELLAEFKRKYQQAEYGNVVGVVFHVFDFYRFPGIYENWFEFIHSKGQSIETINQIIKLTYSKLHASATLDYEASPFGMQDVHDYDPLLDDLGVGWVRLSGAAGAVWDADEPEPGRFDWNRLDKIIGDFSPSDMNMIVTALCFNKWDRKIDPSKVQGLVAADLPRDMKAYKNYIRILVNRYPQVKYWQIENEPDGNGWGDAPENFAILVKESYEAIKESNPEAKVVLAGMSAPEGFYKFYLPVLNELERIKDPPDLRYFDVVDLHWSAQFGGNYRQHISSGGNLNDFLKDLHLKLNSFGYRDIPIWITEMSSYDGKPLPEGKHIFVDHSEAEHAKQLFKSYVYSVAQGVGKIFWARLEEWHNFGGLGINNYWDTTGLINNPQNNDGKSHKKLAYYTYKKMVEALEESDWDNIETIKAEENDTYGIYLYKFTKNKKPVYVGWFDCFSEQKCSRMKIDTRVQLTFDNNVKQIKITEAVPKYDSGKEITDYSSAFESSIKDVSNNKVNIILSNIPVFVEEAEEIFPANYQDSPFGMHSAVKRPFISAKDTPDLNFSRDSSYDDAVNIGVKWERPLTYSFHPLYIELMDIIYGNVPEGMNIIANIRTPRKKGTFKLSIPEQEYIDFVKEVVERYDGDGYNDAPGLKVPIKHWQLDNEPPFFQYGTDDGIVPLDQPLNIPLVLEMTQNSWEDYAHLLKITKAAINSACQDCKLAIGGMVDFSGNELDVLVSEFYEPILQRLNGEYIDIFDFHYYGNAIDHYRNLKSRYGLVKNLLDKYGYEDAEIWITETGTYNNQPQQHGYLLPYQSEKEQARDLVKRYVYSLSVGVKKVFWALSMVEGEHPLDDNNFGDNKGFMYDGIGKDDLGYGTKKLAYYTYKKMTQVLEGSDWDNIQTIQEKDGIYIYKFVKDGKPIWVAWNDNEEPQRISIALDRGIENIKVTEAVPKYDTGKEVKDYNTAFREVRYDIMESYPLQVEFELRSIPVYVEAKDNVFRLKHE